MVPLGLALGIGAGYMIAMWTAVVGVLFLPPTAPRSRPPRPTRRGRPTLGRRVIDHSFQLPLQVCWIVTALAGIVDRLALLRRPHARAAGADARRLREMTVRGAAFLGVGAMVGAGIFALLGQAGAVAGSAVWLSFLLAGIVAALLSATPSSSSASATRPRAASSRT